MSNTRFQQNITLANRTIGLHQPAFIVAEIGINHNGDMGLAKEEIDAAIEAGADSVKFQNYITEDFISSKSLPITYQTYNKQGDTIEITESQYDLFKRNELTRAQLVELADYCRTRNINMHSTPTSQKGIEDLVHAGVDVLKNGSDFLPNLDFVRALAETGLPTVISTGMSTITEIDEAINAFTETGNDQLIVLHCTSAYPTPNDEVNIQRIKTIRDTWGVLSGFSDHSWGISGAVLSVAMGACWIEKHYTLDKRLPGPDHRFSLDPTELKELVQAVRAAESQIGTGLLGPTHSERHSRESFRLSCVAKTNISAGTILTKDNISFHRPGTGLKPALADVVIGRKLKSDVLKGHIFDEKTDFVNFE